MKNSCGHDSQNEKKDGRVPYEPPTIIYKGKISTRAGSPLIAPDAGEGNVADPADLFGDD